jgi:hypothetical protein
MVTIFVDGIAAGSGTAVGGSYSVTLDAALSSGQYVISATAMDDAGNEGELSAGMVITIDLEAPVAFASPGGSVVRTGQPVTLQSPDANARIFYTRDGSQPTVSSTRYTGPIGITTNGTLRYIAVDQAGNASGVMAETYAIDSASPVVAITAPADGAEVRGVTRLSATASDNLEVARVQFLVDGIEVGAADTAAPYQLDWDSSSVLDGTHVITAVAYDRSGNAGSPQTVATVNVINGLVNPTVEAPVAKLTALGTAEGTTAAAVKTSDVDLTWSASHPAGIRQYELQRSLNGGPWETFDRNAATAASQQLAAGTYEFRVRATSNDLTVATGPATTVVVRNVQETAATFTGAWTTSAGANFWDRSLRFASAATARATYQFTGTSIGVVGTRAAGRGRVEITIDGGAPTVVNLYNATAQFRRLVFVRNGLSAGQHTIVVRALNQRTAPATANRVDLDGFVVLD